VDHLQQSDINQLHHLVFVLDGSHQKWKLLAEKLGVPHNTILEWCDYRVYQRPVEEIIGWLRQQRLEQRKLTSLVNALADIVPAAAEYLSENVEPSISDN
jgi:hypothetical protein